MSVEKKVPEIRFEGFSGEWNQSKLEEIVSYIVDNRGKNPKYYCKSGIPVIDNFMIKNNPYPNLSDASRYIDEYLFDNFIRDHNELDDVLITMVGNGIGNITLFPKEKSVIIQNTLGLRFSNNKKFMFYSILFKNKEIVHLDRGMAQPSIRQDELLNLDIELPLDDKEQTQIGNTFQKLDSLINQNQQKHDKLSNIKKAMLEKMFPKQGETVPEIRFKGFSGEWEEKALSEEVTFINGRAYSQQELQDKGKYTVLRVGNFYTNSSWYFSDMELGDKYYANCGDLLYTWSASFGPHIWDGEKVIYHYHIWKLELSDNIDKLFLLHLLDYDKAKILSGSNGSTMIHITKSAMEAKKVFIPKKDEQTAIGNYFQKLDTLINQHQQQITKFNNIKQACLSKMFV